MALIRPEVDLAAATLRIAPPPGAGVPPLTLRVPQLQPPPPPLREAVAGGAAAAAGGAADAAADAAAADAAAAAAATAGGPGGAVVRLDAGLVMERVQVCGDTVCTDLVSGDELACFL